METGFDVRPISDVIADVVIIPAFTGAAPTLGLAADEAITGLYESGEFSGKKSETALIHAPAGLKAKRLLLAGCGEGEEFDAGVMRKVAGTAARKARSKAVHRMALSLSPELATAANVSAVIEGAIVGAYETDAYKTNEDKEDNRVESFSVVAPSNTGGLEEAAARGRILAESQNFTRDLAYAPGNVLPPGELAARARAMADEQGLGCEILDRDRMKQLGMGALLGVAQGSAEPPALIIIRYTPETASASGDHLGLVGKGVTFDTGGISIKPSEKMDQMRYDMSGGATMLGAMRAIAQLKPAIPVTALIPAVENMPGSRAQRPGDIVTSLDGKTVEVLNTDAEGRLILIDALTYAKRLGCTHLVDAATLTGAIVVALGMVHVGAFTNSQELLDKLLASAKSEGENMWHMPLDEDYKEQLKSSFADLQNIGTRWGGAVTAAYFLKEFADPTPWVHLDIAGTAWIEEKKPYIAKGPSGVAVRSLVDLAMKW